MGIEAVGVVIPAHNEAATIGRCLQSVVAAASRVPVPVFIVVVDDASVDCTGDIARRQLVGVPHEVMRVDLRNVGAARRTGHARVVQHFRRVPPGQLWMAATDADSVVGGDWLEQQVALARAGIDAVAGTIRLDTTDCRLLAAFEERYRERVRGETHNHVHGANMGFRASAYLAAGGFVSQACHEDVSLWRRLKARPEVHCRAETGLVVSTSDRRSSRLVGGFASYLAGLDGEQGSRSMSLAG